MRSGATTYGHRFLTTSGRAGRAVKVKTFDDYKARLLETLRRPRARGSARADRARPRRARRPAGRTRAPRGGRSGGPARRGAGPGGVAVGGRRRVSRRVPGAARGSADDDDDPSPALLPGGGRPRQAEGGVSRGDQRRSRAARAHQPQLGARAHGAAARRAVLLERRSQGAARVAHRAAGHDPVPQEARQLQGQGRARRASGRVGRARGAGTARRRRGTPRRRAGCAKADLGTDLVREFTELQGTMGGIYAREEGLPEAVWKAIYYHYLPVAVEAEAAADARATGRRRDDVGGGVDGRQARHAGRAVFRGRAPDRVARPVRPAASGARPVPHAGRSARAHGSVGAADRGRAHRGRRTRSAARRGRARGAHRVSRRAADATSSSSAATTCATCARCWPAGRWPRSARSKRGACWRCCPSSPARPSSSSWRPRSSA